VIQFGEGGFMRKLLGAFALAVSVVSSPTAAQEKITRPGPPETRDSDKRVIPGTDPKTTWYVGGEFGAMIVEDVELDIGAVENAVTVNHEYGYDGGLFVGYDLGAFRIEAEAAYKKADLESFATTLRLPGEGSVFPAQRDFAGGSTSALSFMINGMLDFGDDDGISGFVGGGVGMARVKANNQRVFANTAPFLDDSDSKLAWQVFAGVRQAISDNIDVTVKYRFFNVDNLRMVAFNGNEAEWRFRSHSLLGGLTYRFAKPTPPTEVPYCEGDDWSLNATKDKCVRPTTETVWKCPPPDETEYHSEPPCRDPVRGPFIVFFDWDRPERDEPVLEALSDQAKAVLDGAIAEYKSGKSVRVSIEAHTDTSGPNDYNLDLSKRRLAAVRSYLENQGVPAGGAELVEGPYGEQCPRVESGDGVREPQNRRVELYYGDRQSPPPGSGCPSPTAD
jgi:OOP family OmpA-OmpF porin